MKKLTETERIERLEKVQENINMALGYVELLLNPEEKAYAKEWINKISDAVNDDENSLENLINKLKK